MELFKPNWINEIGKKVSSESPDMNKFAWSRFDNIMVASREASFRFDEARLSNLQEHLHARSTPYAYGAVWLNPGHESLANLKQILVNEQSFHR